MNLVLSLYLENFTFFVHKVARLNLVKYANEERLAKPLFQYIYYHENDVRNVSTLLWFYINEV